jgi:hypothetical protein
MDDDVKAYETFWSDREYGVGDRDKFWCGIPERMRGGLARYLMHAIEPGQFLVAVLSNDLKGAVARGDDENQRLLPEYIRFLYNRTPSGASGSPEKVRDWLRSGGLAQPEPDERDEPRGVILR